LRREKAHPRESIMEMDMYKPMKVSSCGFIFYFSIMAP
jgi:hypothetical protein